MSRERSLRRDVQGLRAVAVLAVVLGHAGVPFLGGGFIGVDVFFVISGFLITGHLARELDETGRVRFGAFYARRARRILPSALVVIAATVIASLLLVSPLRWAQIVEDAIASALSVPNYSFAIQGTDYLAGTAPSPFQHLWSLGVEEQFYLLWPALLLLGWILLRRSRRGLVVLMLLVAVGSFVACLVIADASQPWAFFSLPSRAWELAAGGLLTLAGTRLQRVPTVVAEVGGWVGLALVAGSAVLVPAENWPGAATLLPVVGALAVIAFGSPERSVSRLLGMRGAVAVGGLSYTLYLVHWPLLVIVAEHVGLDRPLPLWARLGLAAAAFPLAWLLTRGVERPVMRGLRSSATPRRTLLLGGIATLAVVALLAAVLPVATSPRLSTDRSVAAVAPAADPAGLGFVPSNLRPGLAAATADSGLLYSGGCEQSQSRREVVSCDFGDTSSPTTVVLFGDSHAGRWFPALQHAAEADGFHLVTMVKSGCRTEDTVANWGHSSNASCDAWRAAAVTRLRAHPPTAIVLANHTGVPRFSALSVVESRWTAGIRSSLDRLPATSRLITLADTPDFLADPRSCLALHLTTASRCAGPRDQVLSSAIDRSQRTVNSDDRHRYLDLGDYFCNAASCPVVIGDTLVYSDSHHVTATYSRELGPVLADRLRPLLPQPVHR